MIHLETTFQPLSAFILCSYFTLNGLSDFKMLIFFSIICRFLERLFERHIKQNKHHLEEVCLSSEFYVFVKHCIELTYNRYFPLCAFCEGKGRRVCGSVNPMRLSALHTDVV